MKNAPRTPQAADADGDSSAEALLPLVYEELRKLASARMAAMPPSHTLQPTALVHEAWLKMVEKKDRTWHHRSFFFAAASTAMRDILVDHARRRGAQKRGGGQQRICLDDLDLSEPSKDEFILQVEDALKQLEALNPELAKIVVMKFYGGMTNPDVAEEMNISKATVERRWAGAKAWLIRQMAATQ